MAKIKVKETDITVIIHTVKDSIEETTFPCQFDIQEMNARVNRVIAEYNQGKCIPSEQIPRKRI